MDNKLKILILEDRPADYELMLLEVDKTGYEYIAKLASNKNAFLQTLDTFTPDLLLLDYSLPGFDGLTAMKMAQKRFGDIPIIIVSGAIGEERAIETLKAGATDYVLKQRLDRLSFVILRAIQEANQLTQTRRMERELHIYAERFRRIFESSLYGVMIGDFSGDIVEANDYYLKITGYTHQDLINKKLRWSDMTAPEYQLKDSKFLEELRKNGSTTPIEKEYITKAGGRVWVLLARTLLPGPEQQFLAFVLDISDRKNAEEQLKVERNFINTVVETQGALVSVLMPDAKIMRFNRACEAATGYTFKEVRGRPFWDFFTPEELENIKQKYRELTCEHPAEYENFITTKNGQKRFIRWRNTVICKNNGEIEYIIATGIDITDRLQSENKIRKLNEELERRADQLVAANKELESFSFSVSHDLRAPVRSMIGFSNILIEEYSPKLDIEEIKILDYIKKAGETMNELIEDMLRLSKINRQEISREEINLTALAFSIVDDLRTAEPERRIDVVIQENLRTNADARLITLALTNLIGNAWKYTKMKENACIEMGSMEFDNRRIYFVKDNGAGFDMKHADKLFEPFRRLHSDKDFPGTGVGLAIVERIIKRHGGKIWAESEAGKGATFFFTFTYNI